MNKLFGFLILLPAIAAVQNYQLPTQAQNHPTVVAMSKSSEAFNYDKYRAVLRTYVSDRGLVNYQQLKANRQQLDAFNASVGAVTPQTYAGWSDSEKIAFLINAYNAFTLQSIIDQNPIKNSIRDISGVWKGRKWLVAGEMKTLDDIEHKTIRRDFNEPRIHVALVCAAMSCPILRNEPYTAAQLDAQLEDQVRKFILSPHGFRIEKGEGRVHLSAIFKWYGKDWRQSYAVEGKFAGNKNERAVLNFLSKYLSSADKQYLEQGRYKISYLNYDWSLNRQ